MAYSDAEIAAALVTHPRVWKFEHRAEKGSLATGVVSRLLTDVVSCTINCEYLATGPNRTADVVFGPDVVFDQLSEAYRPWAFLQMKPARTVSAISDSFNRADSTSSPGVADTGQTWIVPGSAFGISGNRLYQVTPTDNQFAGIPCTTADVVVTAQVTGASGSYPAVVARADSTFANCYLVQMDSATGIVYLSKRVAGSLSNVTSVGGFGPGDTIGVSCQGTTISALVNGATVLTITDSAVSGSTYVGVRAGVTGGATMTWNDFSVAGVGTTDLPADYAGWPMGTFRLSASTLRVAGGPMERPQKLQGYDLLVDYQETKFLDRKVIAAGSNPITEAKLLSNDITASSIGGAYANAMSAPPTATTLPAAMEWPPGTSYLTAINDLLASVNYTPLSITAAGQPMSLPYTAPSEEVPVWTYKVDAASVIKPGVDTELDLFNVPNVWLGFVSEPDRPTLRSVARNDDPASATSTFNRGRQIVKIVDTGTLHLTEQTTASGTLPAATQGDLDALVLRAKTEDSTVYEQVKFDTGIIPLHGVGSVIGLDYGTGVKNYREMSWAIDLAAGGNMKHDCRRAIVL